MDKISYNPFVVHSDEVVHNFSLIYIRVFEFWYFCCCVYITPCVFAFVNGRSILSLVLLCVRLYIIPCVFVWCQREEGFSGFLSILWLLRQQQYEINVLRTISCRLLLPFHSVIFGKNVNQKKMYNSCLTVSNMNTPLSSKWHGARGGGAGVYRVEFYIELRLWSCKGARYVDGWPLT